MIPPLKSIDSVLNVVRFLHTCYNILEETDLQGTDWTTGMGTLLDKRCHINQVSQTLFYTTKENFRRKVCDLMEEFYQDTWKTNPEKRFESLKQKGTIPNFCSEFLRKVDAFSWILGGLDPPVQLNWSMMIRAFAECLGSKFKMTYMGLISNITSSSPI